MLPMTRQHVVGLIVIAVLILLYLLVRYGRDIAWSAR
jgi:preprotein translocase subunit SecF